MNIATLTPLPDTALRLDQVWAALDLVTDPELDELPGGRRAPAVRPRVSRIARTLRG